MGCGYVVISIFLCFSFTPYCITLAKSTDVGGNLQMNKKNTTLFRHMPFPFVKNQDGGGNIISHYAMWRTRPGGFYGLRAEISIWGSPNQEYSQDSGASIQIYCQDGGHYNLIEAGFHVSPSLYHNRDVRFFTYWTKDFKSAGCYNLRCKGFVPASGAALVPGQAVTPPSSYGEYDHYVRLSPNKDPKSEDWVVYRHDLQTPSFLGYFPVQLCSGTPRIEALTGFVNYLKSTHGPPMGSGHFPDEKDDDKTTAYFRHVKNYDSKGRAFEPVTVNMTPLVDKPDCYTETDFLPGINKGYHFHYGGPSGCVG
ncbi:hypothetical protein CFC21_072217 [Triticum aestivum]|uniref:Neprosin PEP catalytic domain-containing protein n=3 Tax=Triticum TaxID=4564 RepID=A0A9R1AMX6_TRITD|nr:uncharacterized protein LOC123116409 [Triticum aestivum]KAF7066196.1 hypothetical protein CFC21_072217 [Triticum aestivum]VAI33706.1 unnamed protein product [Triticum turgidum subsp. durum]